MDIMDEDQKLMRMPKIDLHCHLDGSIPVNSMSHILGREIRPEEVQVGADCRNLMEYLAKFDLPLQCVQTEEGLRTASRDFLLDAAKENICYVEARFAPLSSVHDGLDCRKVVEAVLSGLKEAKEMCDVRYNVIACAMRHHAQEDSLAMMRICREYLQEEGICAVDLAGDEASYPMRAFRELFGEARKLDFPFTIHAGECGSVENVLEAADCGAVRIGHGIALQGHEEAMRICREKRIGIEMCPTSNLQTRAVADAEDYPMREFMNHGLLVTLNTDNRTVSNTTITKEMELVQQRFKIAEEELIQFQKNAIETAFADDAVKHELWKRVEEI